MARLTQPCTSTSTTGGSPKRLAVSLLHSINSICVRFIRQAGRARKKLATTSSKSPLAKPKQLFVTLSNKAMISRHKKKASGEFEADDAENDFGDGGLWQREILMGDKCQPLDFSGVIYYDGNGKRLSELPVKSPRASPMPNYLYASAEK